MRTIRPRRRAIVPGLALLVAASATFSLAGPMEAPRPQLGTPRTQPEPLPPPRTALTLEDLLSLAASQNPEVAAARARVEVARGKMIQAGLYPNPNLSWVASQVL